jgi:DNA-binding HxlR family transcriptional regulator
MRRTNLARALCPIARSLDEIGDWWTLLIVRDRSTEPAVLASSNEASDSPGMF